MGDAYLAFCALYLFCGCVVGYVLGILPRYGYKGIMVIDVYLAYFLGLEGRVLDEEAEYVAS